MSSRVRRRDIIRASTSSFKGALLIWFVASIIEALLYQSYRCFILESIEKSSFFSVLSRYLLFRVFWSALPALVCAALIGNTKPGIRGTFFILAIASLSPALLLYFMETVSFDPAILGFCAASYALLSTLLVELQARVGKE